MIKVDKATGLFLKYEVVEEDKTSQIKTHQIKFITAPLPKLYTIRYMLSDRSYVDVIRHAEDKYYDLEFRPSFPADIIHIVIEKSRYETVVENILKNYRLNYYNSY